ncbi:MAG TPA: PilZ domain-containing protein, partial [Vicinamibacteria bacterium]
EARPLRSEKDVKTLLDLIQEFATLNEAKTLGRGSLPRPQESRWSELKRFYDMLMAQNGLARDPASPFTAAQIRERVAARGRLRVQTDLEIVVAQGAEYHRARVGNISRGGAMLHCDHPFEVGSGIALHMANVAREAGALPDEGRVAWRADCRAEDSYRFRLGVEFRGVGAEEDRTLDSFVVDTLESKLLCLGRDSLDADFLKKESLRL